MGAKRVFLHPPRLPVAKPKRKKRRLAVVAPPAAVVARRGWLEGLGVAPQPAMPAYTDAILYDARGQRIGVMDRETRERRLDA